MNIFKKPLQKIKDAFYSLSVYFHDKFGRKKLKGRSTTKFNEILFIIVITAIPILLFLLGYVYVNISAIGLAFQEFNQETYSFHFVGLSNIEKVINDVLHDDLISPMLGRSLIAYATNLLIGLPLNLIFAFVIYKKMPGHIFFQIILFLPSMVSSMVVTLMFQYSIDYILPDLVKNLFSYEMPNLLFEVDLIFPTLLFYRIWAGFGAALILYSGAMSAIPESIVESVQLNGITPLKEFWYITLPLIWKTISVFLVVEISGIFGEKLALLNFYGKKADTNIQTLGYYFFQTVITDESFASYPYASASGIVFTLVTVPITLLARWAFDRLGPSTEN